MHWPPKGDRASAMRVVLIVAVLLLVAVSGAILVPAAEPIRPYLSEATLALAILVLIGVFSQSRPKAPPRNPRSSRSAQRRANLKRTAQTRKSSTSWQCSRKRVGWSIS